MEEVEVREKVNIGSIEFNFDEIKTAIEEQMSAYTSLEVTEDGIKDAKAYLAALRKMKKSADAKRIAIKNAFMQPYVDFEDKYKDVVIVIDDAIKHIDDQLKDFEDKRIQDHEKHIADLYDEMIGEYRSYLPLERIKKNSWNNKSTTDKTIVFDISEEIARVRSHIDAIKALHSEIEEECLEAYRAAGNDLTAAITKNSDYLFAKSLAEQKLNEKHEDVGAVVDEEPANPEPAELHPYGEKKLIFEEVFTFRITGTDMIQRVKEYLSFNDIPYQEV